MKSPLTYFALLSAAILITGCAADRQMDKYVDNTAYIYLSHYNSMLPSFGQCGPSWDEDSYSIKTPATSGKIASSQLQISNYGKAYNYTGSVEFLNNNKIY